MGNSALRAVIGALLATALAADAQAAGYHAPRNAFGQPDLGGMWNNGWLTKLERPARYAAGEISEAEAMAYEAHPPPVVTDDVGGNETEMWEMGGRLARIGGRPRMAIITVPADGKLPYTEAGRAKVDAVIRTASKNFDNPEPRNTSEQCLIANSIGPPMLIGLYANNIQIVQTRDSVVLMLEWNHEARVVRLGDRIHMPAAIRPWMGDSVGWWEGETLVIETTNFNDRQEPRRSGLENYYLSPGSKVIERFTRISPTEILYQFSVEDPATYRQVWRGELPMVATSAKTFEFACHEGNYSLPGILAGARHEEAVAKSAAAAAIH
ncbi:hypothetical protein [Phenylobacterium sp.]|uniref:hypothetical protein n=1 Tax=Phenylobacterium sp. TaxID=1871053 RepID=UPI00286BA7F1|nr:hypothetical protein [Phenylobacterium sp.]